MILVNYLIKKGDTRLDKVKLNYGKYAIPRMLDDIINLQEELNKEGLLQFGEIGGLYFSYYEIDTRYLNTPLDVIAFAGSGSDGIHFGFLTDFGQVRDLEDAYIVRVSPMDFDDPVQIVARNIHDFLRLVCFTPSAVHCVDITTSEAFINENPDLSDSQLFEWNDILVRLKLRQKFSLKPINCLFAFMQEVKMQRESKIFLHTKDGIGVISNDCEIKGIGVNQDLFDLNCDYIDQEEVEAFFARAPFEGKLVFLRDAQSQGLIFDDEELIKFLKEQLKLMSLEDEVRRLEEMELEFSDQVTGEGTLDTTNLEKIEPIGSFTEEDAKYIPLNYKANSLEDGLAALPFKILFPQEFPFKVNPIEPPMICDKNQDGRKLRVSFQISHHSNSELIVMYIFVQNYKVELGYYKKSYLLKDGVVGYFSGHSNDMGVMVWSEDSDKFSNKIEDELKFEKDGINYSIQYVAYNVPRGTVQKYIINIANQML